jgi:hypothetical protein
MLFSSETGHSEWAEPIDERSFLRVDDVDLIIPIDRNYFRAQPANGDLVEGCVRYYGGAVRHLEYYVLFMFDPNFMYEFIRTYRFIEPKVFQNRVSFADYFDYFLYTVRTAVELVRGEITEPVFPMFLPIWFSMLFESMGVGFDGGSKTSFIPKTFLDEFYFDLVKMKRISDCFVRVKEVNGFEVERHNTSPSINNSSQADIMWRYNLTFEQVRRRQFQDFEYSLFLMNSGSL